MSSGTGGGMGSMGMGVGAMEGSPDLATGGGGKSGGMGGGGGLGGIDLTFGQGKETAAKHASEQKLLEALIRSSGSGMQVTSGQTPGAAPVQSWNPFLVQSLLRSFGGSR